MGIYAAEIPMILAEIPNISAEIPSPGRKIPSAGAEIPMIGILEASTPALTVTIASLMPILS
jgi:hypothetical protein